MKRSLIQIRICFLVMTSRCNVSDASCEFDQTEHCQLCTFEIIKECILNTWFTSSNCKANVEVRQSSAWNFYLLESVIRSFLRFKWPPVWEWNYAVSFLFVSYYLYIIHWILNLVYSNVAGISVPVFIASCVFGIVLLLMYGEWGWLVCIPQ